MSKVKCVRIIICIHVVCAYIFILIIVPTYYYLIMDENCWLRRTPLETALILILTISLIFLILLLSIYIMFINDGCPDCSYNCNEYCNYNSLQRFITKIFEKSAIPSNVLPLKLYEKHVSCSKKVSNKFTTPFIVAITSDIYLDDVKEQEYLCAGSVITYEWVLTSKSCVNLNWTNNINYTGIFVYAGSNFWYKKGSVHGINQIVYLDQSAIYTLAALNLKTKLPRLPAIKPVLLSKSSAFENELHFEGWSWKINSSLPLRLRKKDVELEWSSMTIYNQQNIKGNRRIYKLKETGRDIDDGIFYAGFVITDRRILVGINVGVYCDKRTNTSGYLVYDVSNAIDWLKKVTQVYVEYS